MSMLARLRKAFSGRVRKVELSITAAMLTAEAGEQEFEVPLPDETALVLGYIANITAGFTDGDAGVFTLDLGDGTTADSVADGLEIDAIAKLVPATGLNVLSATGKLSATVLADVDVDTATVGAAKVTFFYVA